MSTAVLEPAATDSGAAAPKPLTTGKQSARHPHRALAVRDAALRGAARRRAGDVGLGPQLDRRRALRGLLPDRRVRHRGRLPPLPHPRLVQGQALAARSRWRSPGCVAIEGSPTQWVADHRRHHQFSDMEGDPHSPWRYGDDVLGAHQGPVVRPRRAGCSTASCPTRQRFAPDLVADKDIQRVDKLFPLLVVASVAAAGRDRRPGHLVLAGRADRAVLGRPGPHRRCCTT